MLAAPFFSRRLPESGFVLRPIRACEGAALQDYFRRLSPEARYFRLHGGASELPASELARALAADGVETLTLLFVHRSGKRETIVGEARAAFPRAERTGEFALSIAEGWRRFGLGAALLGEIERLAAEASVECLCGHVLRQNFAMIALARGRGFRLETGPEARLVRVRKALAGTNPARDDLARLARFAGDARQAAMPACLMASA
jgi:acetyltransferase